jgi:O-antigen/teichoic acid export membrane protein
VKLLYHARRSRFIRHNSIFFIGSAAVGALNYLYYPIMGRLLTPISFGEVQTLVSLFLQIAIFLSVLGLVTINIVANYRDDAMRNIVVLEFEKLALAVGLLLFVGTFIFQNSLKHFLQFDSALPFVLLMLALLVTVPLTFRGAFLRGCQRFGQASLVNLVGAGGKLILAVLFIAIGYGTAGAIGGLIAAQLAACALAFYWAKRSGLQTPVTYTRWRLPDLRVVAPELRYGGVVLVTSLAITLQYSIDVVIVKHYFDPHTAGLYAAIAGVARIIFFLTASIALVLMPMVRVGASPAANRRLLVKSLALLGAAGVPVLGLFMLAPERVVAILMGAQYEHVARLLPMLSASIFIVSLVNLIATYYLALRRQAIALVVAMGAVLTYVLIIGNHASPEAVVRSLFIGSITMLAILAVWMAGGKLRELMI